MKADLEQASWCLLVNVTGERYYGSFEAMSLNERNITESELTLMNVET